MNPHFQERRIGGLQLYWDIIQDDHFISHAISKKATDHLKVSLLLFSCFHFCLLGPIQDIVVRHCCEEYRQSFIKMCALNIQQSCSVPQSLKLLLEILGNTMMIHFLFCFSSIGRS